MRTENQVPQSNNFVSQYAKISWEQLLSFRIIGISKTFMHITVYFRFFVSLSESLGHQKLLCSVVGGGGGGGGRHDIPFVFFWPPSTENFRG